MNLGPVGNYTRGSRTRKNLFTAVLVDRSPVETSLAFHATGESIRPYGEKSTKQKHVPTGTHKEKSSTQKIQSLPCVY